MDAEALKAGDRVYRWWCDCWQPLTVMRVNRLTVTVRTDYGDARFRLPPDEIVVEPPASAPHG